MKAISGAAPLSLKVVVDSKALKEEKTVKILEIMTIDKAHKLCKHL
jgi:hypothetical protein